MLISGNYKDCRAFIHYSNGSDVTCASVVSHNKEYMTIALRGIFNETDSNEFVTVLILLDNSVVHEYRGKLRRSITDNTSAEVALFKGQLKEDRLSKRYPLNALAVVENLITESGMIPLPKAIEVVLVNLSSTGAMLTASQDCFVLDSVVEIKLDISATISTIHVKIVRIRNIEPTTAEYGCELVSAY